MQWRGAFVFFSNSWLPKFIQWSKNSQKFFLYHQSYLVNVQILSPKENYWFWKKVNSSAQPPVFKGSCSHFLSHFPLPNILDWPAFRPHHIACHSPEWMCTVPSTQAHISVCSIPPSLSHFTSLYSSSSVQMPCSLYRKKQRLKAWARDRVQIPALPLLAMLYGSKFLKRLKPQFLYPQNRMEVNSD